MAKFHFKSRPTSRFTLHLEDDSFEVEIAKLSITDLLALERVHKQALVEIRAAGGLISPESYTMILDALSELILRTYGLTDEEGQEIVWSDLSPEQQKECLNFVNIDDVFKAVREVSEIGRLKEDEKKV